MLFLYKLWWFEICSSAISWLSGVIFALFASKANLNQSEKDTRALSHTIHFHGKRHFAGEKKKVQLPGNSKTSIFRV